MWYDSMQSTHHVSVINSTFLVNALANFLHRLYISPKRYSSRVPSGK
jgi:hypothetical protein